MLKSGDDNEKATTAGAIWTLTFNKDVCQKVTQCTDMMDTLRKLKYSNNEEVKRNVEGALFVLEGSNFVSEGTSFWEKNRILYCFFSKKWILHYYRVEVMLGNHIN